MDTWERDGVRRQKLKVRATAIKFLPPAERRDRDGGAQGPAGDRRGSAQDGAGSVFAARDAEPVCDGDAEIPF